jgi:hypothetical protein
MMICCALAAEDTAMNADTTINFFIVLDFHFVGCLTLQIPFLKCFGVVVIYSSHLCSGSVISSTRSLCIIQPLTDSPSSDHVR